MSRLGILVFPKNLEHPIKNTPLKFVQSNTELHNYFLAPIIIHKKQIYGLWAVSFISFTKEEHFLILTMLVTLIY